MPHIDKLFIFNHHDRYITSKYCSHRKERYKQDMSDAMFETRRHKKKVGEEWRKNSGANALKS